MIKCVLLYIRYIIGRCKIDKKYKTLRIPSFHYSFLSLRRGNPIIPLCHFRSLYVIPIISLCHSRESGNPSFVFILYFLCPSVIASTALGAWQSRILSLRAQIYQGAAISFPLYLNIPLFSDSKTIKKL